MNDFLNQVAVVTGASSGIGKAIAKILVEQGGILCLVGRKVDVLETYMEQIRIDRSRYRCYQADLSFDNDIKYLIQNIQNDFEYIDILVHSAGLISIGPLEEAPINHFDDQFRINVRAPYLITQYLLPYIKKRKGQIIFINSSLSLMNARANISQYSATKYALKAIADSLRDEVNNVGIRVLSVYPGRTASPMQAKVHKLEGKNYKPENLLQAEDIAQIIINALRLPRTAEVTDISIRPFIKTY